MEKAPPKRRFLKSLIREDGKGQYEGKGVLVSGLVSRVSAMAAELLPPTFPQ